MLVFIDVEHLQLLVVVKNVGELLLVNSNDGIGLLDTLKELYNSERLPVVAVNSVSAGLHDRLHLVVLLLLLVSFRSLAALSSQLLEGFDRVIHESDGLVDIALGDLLSEVELGHCLTQSDDTKESSWGDVHVGSLVVSFTLELPLLNILGHDVVMEIRRDSWLEGLSVGDESSHDISVDTLVVLSALDPTVSMDRSNVEGESLVVLVISLIEEQEDEVESGEKSGWEIDVLMGSQTWVVSAVEGVSSGQNGGPGIQRGSDTGLGNRDGLLLHNFVDVGSVTLVHLVELIDGADTGVSEDKSTSFKNKLVGDGVLEDSSGQTDS